MRFMGLGEAIATLLRSGDALAMEGFTHLIPFAAGHEIIRQKIQNLTLIRLTPDLLYDQMIGMGAASKLIFSWAGNPGVGSLHRFRDAVENGWPCAVEIEEHGHAGMPSAFFRGYQGSELRAVNQKIRFVQCPFTGQELACVPALHPDVTIIHAQRADRDGNVLIEGILGVQKEAVLAACRSIVTVEEVVDDFPPVQSGAVILPHWAISAVCMVPGGARPSYAYGYYGRDNAFYVAWDEISRDRKRFIAW